MWQRSPPSARLLRERSSGFIRVLGGKEWMAMHGARAAMKRDYFMHGKVLSFHSFIDSKFEKVLLDWATEVDDSKVISKPTILQF